MKHIVGALKKSDIPQVVEIATMAERFTADLNNKFFHMGFSLILLKLAELDEDLEVLLGDAYHEGFSNGYQDGRDDGYEQGLEDGRNE